MESFIGISCFLSFFSQQFQVKEHLQVTKQDKNVYDHCDIPFRIFFFLLLLIIYFSSPAGAELFPSNI